MGPFRLPKSQCPKPKRFYVLFKGLPMHAVSTFVLQRFVHSTSRSMEKLRQHASHVLTNAPCFRGLGEFWLDLKILHSMLLRQHATVVVAHCARQHAQGAPWCVQISQRQLLKPDAAQAHSHSCCGKAPSVSSAAVLAASASSTKLLGGAFGSSDVTLCLGACFGVSRRVHHSFGASKPQSLAA